MREIFLMLPPVLLRLVADYAPEFVQKFLQEDSERDDLAAARTHLAWCDPGHVRVPELWNKLLNASDIGPWLRLLSKVPDRIEEWQILNLTPDDMVCVWHSTSWLTIAHVEHLFHQVVRNTSLLSSRALVQLTQLADILLPSCDLLVWEEQLLASLRIRGYDCDTIFNWWSRFTNRSAEAIANDHPVLASWIAAWVPLRSEDLGRDTKAAIAFAENMGWSPPRRHATQKK